MIGGDPGVSVDPERAAMLGSLQESVRSANALLPERQREVLALRELEELSYDEIAEIMDMNRNSVAQLLSRARIRLRDELRGSALASVAASSPECERAQPLIAMRQDGQLAEEDERAWLAAHLGDCATCKVGVDAMEEAGLSYRAWLPIVPLVWLREATVAKAAELTGSDWSDVAASGRRGDRGVAGTAAGAAAGGVPRGRVLAGTGGVALLVVLLLALVSGADDTKSTATATAAAPPPATTAAAATQARTAASASREPRRRVRTGRTITIPIEAITTSGATPEPNPVTTPVRWPSTTKTVAERRRTPRPRRTTPTATAPPAAAAPTQTQPPPATITPTEATPPPPAETTPPPAPPPPAPPAGSAPPSGCGPGAAPCR